jgi:phospholipid-translocating ATPase
MVDGVYQSAIAFFMVYLLFSPATFNTVDGLEINELKRMGIFVATIAVFVANLYVLFNTYRWDWLMVLIVVISTLLVWAWTGIYTSFTASFQFYKAGAEVYGATVFWAVFFVATIMCLLPRFTVKAIQKLYFPMDVDIIREQVKQGKFDYLKNTESYIPPPPEKVPSATSSETRNYKGAEVKPGDDDVRPIYPPSIAPTATTHNPRSQNGSNSTDYTLRRSLEGIPDNRMSMDNRMSVDNRLSMDRARPSYDRARMSMDRVRPSFEQSNDFTSAAMLSRMESSNNRNSVPGPDNPQASNTMNKLRNAFRRPTVTQEEPPEIHGHNPPSSPPR